MLGIVIGVVSGVIQYFLLMQFTSAVTGSNTGGKAGRKSGDKAGGKSGGKSGGKAVSKSESKSGGKIVLFAITQFVFPFTVLLLCAFFLSEDLMWIGIGMAAALITCAIVRFVITLKKNKDR